MDMGTIMHMVTRMMRIHMLMENMELRLAMLYIKKNLLPIPIRIHMMLILAILAGMVTHIERYDGVRYEHKLYSI